MTINLNNISSISFSLNRQQFIINESHQCFIMQMDNFESPYMEAKLSIDKALQFVGDNSTYQKKRLLILSVIILSTGILTCKISLEGSTLAMLFMGASGAGQIVCPIYMSLRTITIGLMGFTFFAIAFYPISTMLTYFAFLGLGFFGRGFYMSSLIYINEIGGYKFRAWSMIVIFGIWGISSLISSFEKMMTMPKWIWYYVFIFTPFLIDSYFVLKYWEPSPFKLYVKNEHKEAVAVLNRIALENERPMVPYGLEGENEESIAYRKANYWDFIRRPLIRKITVPLIAVWIYREYIYYGSYLIIPNLGDDYSKNYILLSISEIVAALLSYPVKLNIKRTNTFFFTAILVAIFCLLSSFTVIDPECMLPREVCASKYIYRISILMIRFASALMGNVLVSYTLEIYPSNVRSMGFSLCIGVSSLGSIFVPWINEAFIYANLSSFISFFFASLIVFYFMTKLTETYGKMRTQTLQSLQQTSPHISLTSWATLNF